MLRVAGSLVTSQVRAYDLLRMLGRDGHPTALGQAFAEYGLWNTRCTDAALVWLRGQRQEATDEDAARLSPLADAHINMLGRYAFTPPPGSDRRGGLTGWPGSRTESSGLQRPAARWRWTS